MKLKRAIPWILLLVYMESEFREIKKFNTSFQELLQNQGNRLDYPPHGRPCEKQIMSVVGPTTSRTEVIILLFPQPVGIGAGFTIITLLTSLISATSVYAAAEGLVIEAGNIGWNNGYGGYIKIKHPNKTYTAYAHLNKILVDEGKYVSQGAKIGLMGNTGNTHGPTGCHLHFEVRGAKNPFAKF